MRLGIALYWIVDDAAHSTPYTGRLCSPNVTPGISIRCQYQLQGRAGEGYQKHFSVMPLNLPTDFRGVVEKLQVDTGADSERKSFAFMDEPSAPMEPRNQATGRSYLARGDERVHPGFSMCFVAWKKLAPGICPRKWVGATY